MIDAVFGHRKVDSITRLEIKEWLNTFKIKNVSKKNYLVRIKGILEVAKDDEAIKVNNAQNITFQGGYESSEIYPFAPEEVEKLLSVTSGDFRNFLGIALNTGLRTGEELALMIQDIDERFIHVRRAINRNSKTPTTPKTKHSIRKVPILDSCREFLEDQIKRAKKRQTFYLFTNEDTKQHYHDANGLRKKWKRAVKDAGIKYRKLYNTRHTFATAMLRSNQTNVLTISKILGHSSSKMLLTVYANYMEAEELQLDCSINLFRGTKGGTFVDSPPQMVENSGFEPLTPTLPALCSPS